MKIITTSWDDGYKESLDIADLLRKYNIQGTFYVPVNAVRKNRLNSMPSNERFLSESELVEINEDFEIGAHGVEHLFLTEVSEERAKDEIRDSKKILERILKEEICGFAYPAGKLNPQIKEIVKKSGYEYGRTIGKGTLRFSKRYEVPVTIFCYNSFVRKLKFSALSPFSKVYAFGGDWVKSTIKAFKYLKKEGGVLHIAEHPNRIKNPKFKKDIEKVFSKISNHQDIDYLTNKEMVERVLGEKDK